MIFIFLFTTANRKRRRRKKKKQQKVTINNRKTEPDELRLSPPVIRVRSETPKSIGSECFRVPLRIFQRKFSRNIFTLFLYPKNEKLLYFFFDFLRVCPRIRVYTILEFALSILRTVNLYFLFKVWKI